MVKKKRPETEQLPEPDVIIESEVEAALLELADVPPPRPFDAGESTSPAIDTPEVSPPYPSEPPLPQATATIHFGDCIGGMAEKLAADSIDLAITSIPFEELFTYSGKPEDVGNNGSTIDIREGRFALNMRFVAAQLFRVLRPGCNFCCHIQQLLAYKVQHGFIGRRDFRGAMIDVFGAAGFHFVGECAIGKNPQSMAQRLNLHSLQFKTGYGRNSCNLAPAPNDYVLIFQRPGEHPNPPRCLWHASNPTGWITQDDWIEWAKGTWDILEIDIIDGAKLGKESTEEKHVCPLQLEVIRRFVSLYTREGDTVLDPFMGIGSTAWVCIGAPSPVTKLAVQGGPRNVIGFELKESYHAIALKNVARARTAAERQAKEGGLFSA